MKLKFRNGQFTILILADIHLSGREWRWTKAHIEGAYKKAQPDLVVLLGDNITGEYPGVTKGKINEAIEMLGQMLESKKVPFALVFGNHDHEGLQMFGFNERTAKKHILSLLSKYTCCVAEEGEEMTGVGNYNRLIYDSEGEKPLFNLWFADSNPYADESEGGGYGYVHRDQLDRYEKKSRQLREANGGRRIPSFAFQHIIVPEIYEMLRPHEKRVKSSVKGHGRHSGSFYTADTQYIRSGSLREGPCPPDVKSEQFLSWIMTGDIIGAFFGHDHTNDFSGEYKGIKLYQVPSAGFYSYGNCQGSRVVTLFENDIENYETCIMRYEDVSDFKIRNPFVKKHGLFEWLIRWRPIVWGTVGLAALIVAASVIA
ncbi:MAG: metallophosphoesterase [Acutalibacteraceae bacterium]|nr:metallophosphoesterase [Acutalibacteraceae bacterium]